MKQVYIKPSDLAKLPASIRDDAELMGLINTILTTYTKLEAILGYDLILKGDDPAPTPEPPPEPAEPPPPPPDPSGPVITGIKHRGERMVQVRTSGCEGWPTRTETKLDGRKKTTMGRLYINGVYVDAMRPDQFHGADKDLENAFGTDEHSLNVRTGQTTTVTIRSYDGRTTAPFAWQWPFAST